MPGYLSWVVQRLHVSSKYWDWFKLHAQEHLMWRSLLPFTEMASTPPVLQPAADSHPCVLSNLHGGAGVPLFLSSPPEFAPELCMSVVIF